MYRLEVFTIQPEPDSGQIVESAVRPEPEFTGYRILSPVWALGCNVPLTHLLILALYILFACLLGFPSSFFFTYFSLLIYFLAFSQCFLLAYLNFVSAGS